MGAKRDSHLESICETLSDYRKDEIPPRTPAMVDHWVRQFDSSLQLDLLDGLDHVLKNTYLSKATCKQFLDGLIDNVELTKNRAPEEYWREANILDIQLGGNSQRDLRGLFSRRLHRQLGFDLTACGSPGGEYIYLDDCMGTGNRVKGDLVNWISTTAPKRVVVHVICMIQYRGTYWIERKIQEAAAARGKTVEIHKWAVAFPENRRTYRNDADVLWPVALPDHPAVNSYVQQLADANHDVLTRSAGGIGEREIYRDDNQKQLLESAFLVRGCEIRQQQINLRSQARPLGYHNLDCLGFGSMFVTYRNCPNNCPLALWVEQAAYPPLLPRKTNATTALQNVFRDESEDQ